MTPRYFDAHCHVQFEQYDADRDELLDRMKEQGVAGIIVGVDLESSKKAVALAEQHEHLFASIGLHPNHLPSTKSDLVLGESDEQYDAALYRVLAKSPKVVAVGECGLDYYRQPYSASFGEKEATKGKQKQIFNEQIDLAAELDKPLIIHARPSKGTMDAYQDLIDILTKAKAEHPKLRGDIHFFVGGIPEMQAMVALDFTVSFTAVITFTHDYDEVIRATPLTHILSETDAPYVAPASRRGSRNDPLAAIEVVEKMAYIRGENVETVRAALLQNTRSLFGLLFTPGT